MLTELESEKETLEEDLKISAAPKNASKDKQTRNLMSAILNRQEYYEQIIEVEKDKVRT